jgi:hypothetical protein
MSRNLKTFFLRVAALGAAACSSAYAVRSATDSEPLTQVSQPLARSPYHVELIGAEGRPLDTYERGDRFYVLGQAGDRYSIRVVNPTDRRIEALISVDGLDVIDGEDADFADKRGYVVPPRGDLVVDGFRMSTTQVAAFRFSSVGESYADLKGKGRNVGVIGVAIFEEKQAPQIAEPLDRDMRDPADEGETPAAGAGAGAERKGGADSAADGMSKPAPVPPASSPAPAPAESGAVGGAPGRSGSAAQAPSGMDDGVNRSRRHEEAPVKRSRPGLGTQWGEERYSAVDFTSFKRAHETVPTAIAELRYNDAEGLRALGIALSPQPDDGEIIQRETADPFPAARGFATPPQ